VKWAVAAAGSEDVAVAEGLEAAGGLDVPGEADDTGGLDGGGCGGPGWQPASSRAAATRAAGTTPDHLRGLDGPVMIPHITERNLMPWVRHRVRQANS
jgi:hypothetical protein